MATLDYITIPPCATRLQSQSQPQTKSKSNDLRPAQKLRTSLPRPPPEGISEPPTSPILKSFASSSAFNLLPQMLLSSSLPSGTNIPSSPGAGPSTGSNAGGGTSNPGRKRTKRYLHSDKPIVLLSNKDPLAMGIMTVNFKRFVERVGPVFWLQDRIEEIVCWKRGWKLTSSWLAGYALICYFPKLVFVLPHIVLIAIMLSTCHYPEPPPPPPPSLFTAAASPTPAEGTTGDPAPPPLPPPVAEDTVDWQANIQAIQNLMGFYSDAHALVTPHLTHLSLSSGEKPKSPYAFPLLAFLIITLLPTLILVSTPWFPTRAVCFVAGAGPVLALHPSIPAFIHLARERGATFEFELRIPPVLHKYFTHLGLDASQIHLTLNLDTLQLIQKKARMWIQRIIDDNNLSDTVWNSEMTEVELYENERLSGKLVQEMEKEKDGHGYGSHHQRLPSTSSNNHNQGWAKQNLLPTDRSAWTRGRDGWSGVGADGSVSSNLTFSLSPGWTFIPTEDWRADLEGWWCDVGADEYGWVYTNSSWQSPAAYPYQGAVTRRRRWVRRVWYDKTLLEGEGKR
uniref:Peroxin/Ferlin domain-containing protein n=1 Tax=Moniliophthora roreri TaxID=221103 RepID=A0A0W0F3Q8_MONRR